MRKASIPLLVLLTFLLTGCLGVPVGLFLPKPQLGARIAIVNPDHFRIVKFAYLHGDINDVNSMTYYSIAMGEALDRGRFNEICPGEWTNPDCWIGVGEQPDFLGSILSENGYSVDYFSSDTLPEISPSDYSLVIVQDPITEHLRTYPKSVDTSLPDLLEKVTSQLVARLINYFNEGGNLLLVGDAVRILENSSDPARPRLNFGKVIQAYNPAHILSYSHSGLPSYWLFIRGNPFCGVDRHGSATYRVESGSLLPAGTVVSNLSFFDGNDLPVALTWSETIYYPSDGISLLTLRVQGSGEYVLRGDICSPPVYTVTVDDVLHNFMGYTIYNGRKIYYIGSDSFFNYEIKDHAGAWHASQYREIRYTTSQEGIQAFLKLVKSALGNL